MHHHHNHALVVLSILIASFASYTALDLANSLTSAKGKARFVWLIGGSLAMGVGIWSMHFIGMLAFRLPGIDIYYDVPLLILSIVVAILASALALHLVSSKKPTVKTFGTGSLVMGAAIAGMHYIGIWSMRLNATIQWNLSLVVLSILIALLSSFAALMIAFKLRNDLSLRGFLYRGLGGIFMGIAISGMHYTAMAAMHFTFDNSLMISSQDVLASDGLAAAVVIGTIFILGIALTGSNVERALTRKDEGIRLRDEFMSIASHELKTPLTSAKLQTELIIRQLLNSDIDKEKIIKNLTKSRDSLERIAHLIEDMLDISRITSGKIALRKVEADLGEVAEDVFERFKPQFENQNTPVEFKKNKAIGAFDPYRIEQVIANLLTNALKYGECKLVEICVESGPSYIQLEVKDKGMGIPETHFKKVFERFERAVDKNQVSGLGIGLFIVKEIIEAHGGTVWFDSELGKGSTFYFRLPKS